MIQVLDEALTELLVATKWYDLQRGGLGDELLEAIHGALTVIQESPRAWPQMATSRGARRYVCKGFPYAIFYTIHNEVIWVVAIAHTSRHPNYWLHRLNH